MTTWFRPPGSTPPLGGLVDEFEGHEFVAGEFQHREAAELGLGHVSEHLVPECGAEGERPFEIGDPQADVQRPHREVPSTAVPDGRGCGHPPTCARSPTSSRQAQCSTIEPSATRQMWMKSHVIAFPLAGSPASSGIEEAT
jgi:hypothetical protein